MIIGILGVTVLVGLFIVLILAMTSDVEKDWCNDDCSRCPFPPCRKDGG